VVECDLAKVEVAGSNPVSRSKTHSSVQPQVETRASCPNRSRGCFMMSRFCWLALFTLLVVLAGAGCGDHKLNSISLSPATADAKDFGGQVQFTATGTFSDSSKPVPLKNITWCVGSSSGICNGNIAAAATVDGNGMAQCVLNSTGTVTVLAGTPATSPMMPDKGQPLQVFGMARLTCP
jgi:hypothetical protein